MTSRDGINWHSQTRGSIFWSADFTGRDFLVGGDSGSLLFSDDGINWLPSRSSPYARLFTYFKGFYIGFRRDTGSPDLYTAPLELWLDPRLPKQGTWDISLAGLSTNHATIQWSRDLINWEPVEDIQGENEEKITISVPTGPIDERKFIRVKSESKADPYENGVVH